MKHKRLIMKGAKEIKFNKSTLKIYTKEENGFFFLQIFEGRRVKPNVYTRHKTFASLEKQLKSSVADNIERIENKELFRRLKKEKVEELKSKLITGAVIRASFSYNMTFNYFYRVISNKGSVYKLEILEKEWVSGDFGYTGEVKPGCSTGKIIEGKMTTNGLKVNDLYCFVIDPSQSFYENHLD